MTLKTRPFLEKVTCERLRDTLEAVGLPADDIAAFTQPSKTATSVGSCSAATASIGNANSRDNGRVVAASGSGPGGGAQSEQTTSEVTVKELRKLLRRSRDDSDSRPAAPGPPPTPMGVDALRAADGGVPRSTPQPSPQPMGDGWSHLAALQERLRQVAAQQRQASEAASGGLTGMMSHTAWPTSEPLEQLRLGLNPAAGTARSDAFSTPLSAAMAPAVAPQWSAIAWRGLTP